MIRSVIFDFDGTLADTNEGIVKTFQETFLRMGFEVPSREVISSTIGLTLEDGFRAALPSLSDAQVNEAAVYYRDIFLDIAIPCTTAFPQVKETLTALKERGCMLSIATSRTLVSLARLCDALGVTCYFDGFYGEESVKRHKPAPDLVNLILKEMSLRPEECLVVGDATFDLLMGQGAGCKVCAVTWGNQSRSSLLSVNPDFVVDSMPQILSLPVFG